MPNETTSGRMIRLTAKESREFAAALLAPREPPDRLLRAAGRYIELLETGSLTTPPRRAVSRTR